MAMTTGIIATQVENDLLRGARRSRFSFRFKTPRVSRWLLIQMVSVPETADEVTDQFHIPYQEQRRQHLSKRSLSHVLENHLATNTAFRYWI